MDSLQNESLDERIYHMICLTSLNYCRDDRRRKSGDNYLQ
jgi:hypothetical protein